MDDDVLVLWDIDGTLLNADGVGRDLYHEVFAELFGRPLEACPPMAGRTDRAIILQTLTMAGVDEPRRYVDPFIAGLGAHAPEMRTAVAERGAGLPGAAEVLAALTAASGTAGRVPIITYTTQDATAPATVLNLPAHSGAVAANVAAPAVEAAVTVPAAAVLVSAGGATAVHAVGVGTAGSAVAVADGPGPEPDIPHQAARGPGTVSVKSAPTGPVAIEPTATGAAVANHPSPAAVAIEPSAMGAVVANVPPPAAVAVEPTGERTATMTATAPVPGPVAVGTAAVSLTGAGLGGAAGSRADGRQRRLHQSVLTGSIRMLAEVKLTALGLRDGLDLCIGAYGDDHEDRAELIQVARRRAAAVHGRSPDAFAGAATVVIGDTPGDVAAALAAGARAVAVATGAHSATELHSAGAYAVLRDLTDTELVLEALLG
jgi:phosphoglycolate phosphatase-like HAD superfamily hydrolase